ncbi:MAG: fibronectin type III domain-containing protein [Muribaculaceae bacterium]|nr:fibronectin type III domain-containing protein [Muribaculaceae bacterium]
MKNKLQVLIAMMFCTLWVAGSYAQTVYIEDYTCSSSMETYTPLGSTATVLSPSSDDDGYATLTLPFAFTFGSTPMTAGSSIYMSVNGFITLNTSYSSTTPPYTGSYNVISPLGHDLHLRTNGQLKSEVSGTAPDRVLTLQWSNVESYSAGNTYNFQVKLYEGSNDIKFCYGNSTVTASKSVYCFLREYTQENYVIAMNNWNTPVFVTSGSTFYKNLDASQYPSNGRTYTFARPTPTCSKPTSLVASNVTASSATITWTAGGSETSWEVVCAELSDDISTLTPTVVTTPSYTAQNLINDHQYVFYVRSQCPNGVETSAWKSMIFRTDCGAGIQSLPYMEDFSSYGGTGSYSYFPTCWQRNSTAGSYPYISSTGGNSLYLYTTGSYYTVATTPALDPAINASTVAARFKMYAGSQTYVLKVGVMSDPNDINTFVLVSTITPMATGTWDEYDVYFNSYTGTGQYIAFLSDARTLSSTNVVYIDDVSITPLPTCARPASLHSTAATENSVTLEWSTSGTESQWNIKYYETGDTTTMVTTVANAHPFTVTGLTANTSYTFFVQANCGTETSEWSTPYTTPTLYVAPAVLPFVCDFETSTEAANWGFENDTCANQWVIGNAVNNTLNGNSALYVSNDNGTSNSYTFTAPATVYAVRDILMDNSYDYYTVTYDYKVMGQGTTDYLRLYLGMTGISMVQGNAAGSVNSIPGAAVLNIDNSSYQSSQADWRHVNLLLDKDTWGNRVVRLYFMWHNDASLGQNPAAAIDNLVVKGYTCPMVASITVDTSTLTTTSATINWTDTLNTGIYEVVIVPQGGNPDSYTPISMSSTSYTFTGLTHSTLYTAYVRMSCGADMSAWRGITFSTECGQLSTLPYTQNFDGMATGSSAPLPNCWTRTNNYSTYPYLSTSYHASGNASLYFYGTTAYYSYAVLPEIDTNALPINTLMLNLKSLKTSTTSTYGRFDVGVMSDPANVNTFTVVKSFYGTDMPQTATWYDQEVMFNNYTGNGSYIAIRVPNEGTSNVYIDDVVLGAIPSCLPPSDIAFSGITSDEVTISWVPRNGEYNWNVVVVPAGADVSTGTPEMTSTYPYTVSNLQPNTQYDVYVKADCGGGDESSWSPVSTFTTKCVPTSTIPYTESFEGYGSGTGTFPNCWTRISTYNAQYPYISTSIHSDGAAALYFYQTSGTYTTLATTQALDLSTYNPGELALSFHLSAYSSLTYARMDVGVMTDPTDMGTFTILRSFYPGDFTATNQWREFFIPLTQQYTTPVYFAFYLPQSSTTTSMYLDQVKVDYAPDCSAPTNLSFTNIAGSSALVSWTPSQFGDGDYTVEYSDDNVNWTTVSTSDNFALLSGLMPTTVYNVQVYRNCTVGNSTPVSGSFTTGCLAGGEQQIGTGNTTSYLFPLNNFYNYTYTQQIYLASEIGGARDITGIMFDYAYSSAMTSKTDVKIYLGHTTQSTFSSTSNYVPLSNLQLVYSGNLNCHNGWNTFQFDSIFHYDGTSNIVLAVDDNSGSYNGTSYVFNIHSTGSNYRSLYYYSDSNNPDPSNPTSGSPSSSYSSGNRNNVKFISPCDLTVTCIAPNLVVSDVTSQDITLDWVPGGTESQWELKYKIGNGNWISVGTVTTPPYILTNVTTDVDYTFQMRSDCGNNEYSTPSTATVHVPCTNVATLPLTENFDLNTSSGSGHMVPCWTRNTNYTSTLYPYTSNSYHYSGSYSVYFYGSSSAYSYIASPRFDDNIQMDSLLVTFWAYKTSANYFIEVGVMSDPYDISTFVPVGTFSPQQLNHFEFGGVNTRGYAGNGHYIAFRCPQWIANYIYLDDVTIDYIPDCYFVRNPHVVESSITPTSARVAWAPGSDETDWEVVIGVAGSITDPSTQTIDMVQNTPSFEFTNLIPNTLYEVYVRANCGGSYSIWMKCMFRTGCAAITTLPYTEDFEGYPSNTSTTPTANNLPNCWEYRNTSPSTSSGYRFYPILYTSSTYAHNSQNSMRFYVYTTTSTYGSEIGILPEIDTTVLPINTLRLTFWQRAYSTSSSSYHFPLEVGVMSDPTNAASFVLVDTFSMEGTGSTTYVQRTLDFTNYTGGGNRIAFRVAGPTASGYNYGYVDDIMIDYAPQCLPPTHLSVSSLTSTEATISWQPGDQEYEWTLIVYPAGTSPAAGVTVTVNTDTFYTVSNLTPNTYYQVLLKSNCPSGTGYSSTVETTFATMCNLISNLPFTENFDGEAGSTTTSVTNNNLPDCWFYHNTGTSTSYSGYPIIYNSAANAESGTNSMRFYVSTTTGTYSTQWAMLPGIDVTQNPMNTLMLSFDARSTSTTTPLVLEVGVMDNPLDISTFTLVSILTVSGTTYSHQEVFFPNYTGTGNVIAIRAPQGGSSNYGNVDNIVVDLIPDCSPVNNLAVSQVTATSAVVTWNQGTMGVPVGFDLEYTEYGQNNWISVTGITDNFYILSGLTMNTMYEVRVRTDCGLGTSTWQTTSFLTRNCLVGGTIEIGQGTATSSYFPSYSTYNYSYTQQLFMASEFSGPTQLSSLSVNMQTLSQQRTMQFYLMTTTSSSLSSGWLPTTNAQLVFSGSQTLTTGWNEFVFTNPFNYNGTDNLVLITVDMTGSWVSGNTWYGTTMTSGISRYIYEDGSPYSISVPSGSGTVSSFRNNVRFGGQCDNTVTCVAPNMYVANITSNSAELHWAPGYMESAWNLMYKAQNDNVWTTVPNATSPVSLTGLIPNTLYNVRIQSDCGGDTSAWVSTNFRTECAAITVPYSENFDSYGSGTNVHPSCWTMHNNYNTTTAYPYINTSYHTSGTAGLYFYCSTSTYNLAVAPQIDLTSTQMNNLQVSFQMRSTSAITSGIVVGVMTDPNDITTFVPVDTMYNSVTATFELMEVPLNTYNGAGEYVALKLINSTSTYSVYIDDFTIENIPTCVRPTNLTATATQTDITLGWNDANTGYEWIIEYGPGNFTQGTGTTVVANNNPYTITGLTPSSVYTFYVRGICSATDSSNWSLPFHATTACAPIATLPYTENFDAYSGSTTTSVANNNLPVCWNYLNTTTNSNYTGYPIIYSSSTYAHSGTKVLRFYAGTSTYGSQMAILPQIDDNVYQVNTLQISFYARALNTSYPFKLVVGVLTNPTSMGSFTPIDTLDITSTTHTLYEIPLNHYTGTGSYIGILAPQPTTGMNYGYVDNVTVEPIPTCPKPTSFTAVATSTNSINLSWNENGTANSWEIEYSTSPFTPGNGTGTTVQAMTNPFTLTGLTTSTQYYFYVRSVCSTTDQSNWSNVAIESTLCDVIVVTSTNPYTENFDNVGTSLPSCWTNTNDYGTTDWNVTSYFEGSVMSAHSGTKVLQFYQGGDGDEASVQMPTFDLSGLTNPSLTYWYTNEDWAGDQDELKVYYRTSPTGTWTQLTSHANSIYTWTYDSLALPNPSATYQIKFKGLSNYGYGINIDDITISGSSGSPSIIAPTVTTNDATNIAQTGATLNGAVTAGSESITAQGFEWKATSGGTYTQVNATGTTMSFNLTSLTPNTNYTFRAFATTASGTTYGAEKTFTTLDQGQEPCPTPTNIQATNITETTADISWTQPNNTATSWDVLYKESAADSWYTATTSSNPYTLTGLNGSSSYDVQVIAHCTSSQTSDPSAIITFMTVGIDDYTLDNTVNVYPNPTNGNVHVQCSDMMESLEIYDTYGKLLGTETVNSNVANVDLTSYAKGTYFVRVTTDKGVVTKRVVKQ